MGYKAFISSTFLDLKDHRSCVIEALERAGFDVDPMERWTAAADEPKHFSQQRVRGCDVCVLLVGWRRGHVPEGEAYSVTQLEQRYAEEHGIDVLVFMLPEDAKWSRQFDDLDRDPALRTWRAALTERYVVGTFSHEPSSVPIQAALTRWVAHRRHRDAVRAYLSNVMQAHGSLRLLGLPYVGNTPDVPIERMYIEPRLARRWISADVAPTEWPETASVIDTLVDAPAIVVLGGPGSGKSALVSWVSSRLADARLASPAHARDNWTRRLGALVPIPIVVRDLRVGSRVTWSDLLTAFLDQPAAAPLSPDAIEGLLEDGDAIVMLDGVDEFGPVATLPQLRDAVIEGMRRFPRCRWLVTSRVIGYESFFAEGTEASSGHGGSDGVAAERRRPSLVARYVAPFDDEQVERFVGNWFAARESDPAVAAGKADALRAAVLGPHGDPTARRLARVPNLLTMMALIFRLRARLPHGRALLYDDITRAYLESIDESRRLQRLDHPLADQKRWLARVGFEMQRGGAPLTAPSDTTRETQASAVQVRRWIADAMADRVGGVSDVAASAFLDHTVQRSGLLVPRDAARLAFAHTSFQEYFAASFLLEHVTAPFWLAGRSPETTAGVDQKTLTRLIHDPGWREVLVFLFELLADRPGWPEAVAEALFGPGLADVPGTDAGRAPAVTLLARLAVNPYSGLPESIRTRALDIAVEWEVLRQHGGRSGGVDVRRVLFADPKSHPRVLAALALAVVRHGARSLDLSGTALRGITPLATLTSLERLDLSDTAVTDVAAIRSLENLKSLDLSATGVTDITALGDLKNLRLLILQEAPVRDLRGLAGCANLQALHLHATTVSDVNPISRLTELTYLDLSGTNVDDVTPLGGLTKLRVLDLSYTLVRDVRALGDLPDLEALDLDGTAVRDLSPLRGLVKLKTTENRQAPE